MNSLCLRRRHGKRQVSTIRNRASRGAITYDGALRDSGAAHGLHRHRSFTFQMSLEHRACAIIDAGSCYAQFKNLLTFTKEELTERSLADPLAERNVRMVEAELVEQRAALLSDL